MRTPGACCSMTQCSKGWYWPAWGVDVFKVPSHTSSHWVLTKSRVLSRRTWFSSRRCEKLRWRKRCAPHSPAGTRRAWGQARVPPVRLPAQRGTHDPSSSKAPRGRAAECTGSRWTGAEEPQGGQMEYVQGGLVAPYTERLVGSSGPPRRLAPRALSPVGGRCDSPPRCS